MKLSEAIALGRTLIPEMKGGDLRGCALGMGLLSIGKSCGTRNTCDIPGDPTYGELIASWPWLAQYVDIPESVAGCGFFYGVNKKAKAYVVIYALFDNRVMTGNMTLDELIDWIQSIEPQDDPIEISSVKVAAYVRE